METTTNRTEIINTLRYFTGSEKYYLHRTFGYGFVSLTEGASFVRDVCQSHWFFDLILSYQHRLRNEEFQEWELCKTKNETWTINCADRNSNTLASHDIPYTGFPLNGIILWKVEGNVICLPSEY